MPKIKEMFAYIAEEAGPDDEGVTCFFWAGTAMPMVGADLARMESLKPMAQAIAAGTGKKVKLVRFSHREEVEEILPS